MSLNGIVSEAEAGGMTTATVVVERDLNAVDHFVLPSILPAHHKRQERSRVAPLSNVVPKTDRLGHRSSRSAYMQLCSGPQSLPSGWYG